MDKNSHLIDCGGLSTMISWVKATCIGMAVPIIILVVRCLHSTIIPFVACEVLLALLASCILAENIDLKQEMYEKTLEAQFITNVSLGFIRDTSSREYDLIRNKQPARIQSCYF